LLDEAASLRLQLAVDAGAAFAALVAVSCLAVYKQAGLTSLEAPD
jgi:hypothetical protein